MDIVELRKQIITSIDRVNPDYLPGIKAHHVAPVLIVEIRNPYKDRRLENGIDSPDKVWFSVWNYTLEAMKELGIEEPCWEVIALLHYEVDGVLHSHLADDSGVAENEYDGTVKYRWDALWIEYHSGAEVGVQLVLDEKLSPPHYEHEDNTQECLVVAEWHRREEEFVSPEGGDAVILG